MTAIETARPSVAAAAPGPRRAARRTIRGWIGARLLRVLSAALLRLPERLLHRAAHLCGGVLYRVQPARRRLVRANLQRVVHYLAESGEGGGRVAAAAREPRSLDRLVRDAFGHYLRGYLETATLARYASEERLARVGPDDPAQADKAFGARDGRGLIIVGLHFGAIEIPGLWATKRLGRRITAPMETIDDRDLQAYFERSRRQTGLNVIAAERAATELRASLGSGEAVGLVEAPPTRRSRTPLPPFCDPTP
ncbi:MAG: lysophospholipid acyltransferase family protein, partial [Candidatus Limnocylindrales bacterium]